MAAKKAPRKRIKPVVEEMVDDSAQEAEEAIEEKSNMGTSSIEPDFSTDEADANKTSEPESESETEPETEEAPASEEEKAEPEEEVVEEVVEEEPQETDDSSNEVSQETETPMKDHKISVKTILLITVLSALVAAFVSGGVYVYLTGVSKNNETSTQDVQTETQSESTPTPTPTPEPEDVDLTSYEISILNGSGKIGAAGAASDLVEGEGFEVASTGNADSYDFEATVVQAKKAVPATVISTLKKALEASYEVEVGDTLDSDSDYDIVITVGSK